MAEKEVLIDNDKQPMTKVKKYEKKESSIVEPPNAIGDAILVSILYFNVGLTTWALYRDDITMAYAYFIGVLAVGILVKITKSSFEVFGKYFSRYCLAHLGDPLKKKTTMKKWKDQSWQLAIHSTMAYLEYDILSEQTWWTDPDTIWTYSYVEGKGCPFVVDGYSNKIKLFLVFQMAIWTYTAFSCKYLEEVRKDYFVMMTHHVITITLVAFGYILGHLNMSICLLYLHDLSDIPLDILKMTNYIKLGGKKGLFVTEITFVVLLIDWFYFRVYLLPAKLIWSSIYVVREICHVPATASMFFPAELPFYFFINSLLTLLWCLHIWWGFLILRLLLGIFTKGSHQTAEDEYEGGSSDDENNKKED